MDDGSGYNWWGEDTEEPAAEQPRSWVSSLTSREREVLRLLGAGRRNKEIAGDLVISLRTAEWHVRNLHRKSGTHGRRELVALARELGMAPARAPPGHKPENP